LVYDVTNKVRNPVKLSLYSLVFSDFNFNFGLVIQNSFDHIDNWLAEIAKYTNENPMKLLIGSRADLAEQRVVSTEQGAEVARRLGIGFFETSAKTGTQVSDAFTAMTRDLFKLTYALDLCTIIQWNCYFLFAQCFCFVAHRRAAQAKSAESKVESVTVDGQNTNAAKSGCC
jgi:GTPase SAR1 family protein